MNKNKRIKHGHRGNSNGSRSKTYNSWRAMRQRCLNPNHEMYKYYGEIGVGVCERWNKFVNFLEDMGERPHKHTLDRINPHKNYGPNNCKWATHKEQAANKRRKTT